MLRKLQTEIATAQNDPRFGVFKGEILEPEDPFLATFEGIERYQDLLLDPDIYACFQKRVLALVSREWRVDAIGKDPKEQRNARFIRWMLEHKILFDRLCLDLLEALIVGFKVGEIIWQPATWKDDETGKAHNVVIPKDIRVKSSDRFIFVVPTGRPEGAELWGYELRLLTTDRPVKGVGLPDKKFIIHTVGSKTSNPYGNGLGAKLYWPKEFKAQTTISALIFGDRFAQPTVIGKCRPEQNRDKLQRFVSSISEGTSATLPEGMEISLLEASRSSSQNFYSWMLSWCEDQIKKTILSETFGDVSQGLSGQPAANDETARQEAVKADADLLSATLNKTLIAWAVELSFGKDTEPPTVWREFNREEDLNSRVNRDKTLETMGFRLTFEKLKEIYGEGYKDLDADKGNDLEGVLEETLDSGSATPESEPEPEPKRESEAAPEFQEYSDKMSPLVAATATAAQGQIKDWLQEVRSLMDDIGDSGLDDRAKFEEFQNRLVAMPELLSDDLEQAIARGTTVTEMGGQYDVLEEIE